MIGAIVIQVQLLEEFESRLPPGDTNPYRTGPWRPQTREYVAWDLEVEGEIPTDLNGVYLRNTENPLLPPVATYHPFDGDGMVHSMSFEDGDAIYHNRFVRTRGFLAELEAGRALWAGLAESPELSPSSDGWGARGKMKDASSTDVVVHGGLAFTSFYQCGDLYRLDPVTLRTLGTETWSGAFPAEGVSAHTKIDEASGEMLFFNYSTRAPYMHYGVVSSGHELVHYIDIPLPGPRLSHDMAFTENFAILNDCPLFWDPEALGAGSYRPRYFPELPTRFAIVPRRGTSAQVVWFEAEPTFVLHWINAFEDGDEVVLDGFFQQEPSPIPEVGASLESTLYRYLDLHRLKSVAHRWRFNLKTGETKEERLSDRVMEFGMINGTYAGRRHRYSYNALPTRGWFGFGGVVKHDTEVGTEEVFCLPDGVHGSETVMAPRTGAKNEDDGYLLMYVSDMNRDTSACLIFDASDPKQGPIAKVGLPERISSGTHAHWAAGHLVEPMLQ